MGSNPRAFSRGMRTFLFIVGILVTATAVGLAWAATARDWDGRLTPGASRDDTYTINTYEAHATLRPSGALEVTEDIWVTWHEPRLGLIRRIDRATPAGRAFVDDIGVSSTTQEDVWMETESDDGVVEVHLGEEDVERPLGQDHYQITYALSSIVATQDGTPVLRWDTFGHEWDTEIEEAVVTLDLPDGDHTYDCVTGAEGQAADCGGEAPQWQAEGLSPGHGVTVEAQMDPVAINIPMMAETDLDPLRETTDIEGQRVMLAGAMVAAGWMPLLATVGMPRTRRWRAKAVQTAERTPPASAPPPGMSPVTGAMLAHGSGTGGGTNRLFAAWLMDAQQRGLIEASEQDKGFRARWVGEGEPDSQAEQELLEKLVPPAGSWMEWNSKTRAKTRQELDTAFTALAEDHRERAGVPKFNSVIGVPGVLLIIALIVVGVGLLVYGGPDNPGPGILTMIGLFVAVVSAGVYNHSLRTQIAKYDDRQLMAWQQVEGLRRTLKSGTVEQIQTAGAQTGSAEHSPLYPFLPWVVAFGLGDEWTRKFGDQLDESTPGARPMFMPLRSRQVSKIASASGTSSSGGGGGVGSGGGGGGGGAR